MESQVYPSPLASPKSTPNRPYFLVSPQEQLEHLGERGVKFASMVQDQHLVVLPEFTLESGKVLKQVTVAYKTWGQLNETKSNVMVICHALSGSCDVQDWWGPLLGPGKPFDPEFYFIFSANVLGSPYGTASPVTLNPDTKSPYGPEFPATTIRDDVRLHKLVLDILGIDHVHVVIGGSMGGMHALEWGFVESNYVRHIVTIATSCQHSAWCISWNEAQRQAIYSDPLYNNGYYTDEHLPLAGLSAARMSALLTYRSRHSFESRFGRKVMQPQWQSSVTLHDDAVYHNEGNKFRLHSNTKTNHPTSPLEPQLHKKSPHVYSAQSYLRYQGDKFIKRFDANCYIAITRKLDHHDVFYGRSPDALSLLSQPVLVVGVESDGLFPPQEQEYIVQGIGSNAQLAMIHSVEGHDGFLLEFDQMQRVLHAFLVQAGSVGKAFEQHVSKQSQRKQEEEEEQQVKTQHKSVFGESDDMMMW